MNRIKITGMCGKLWVSVLAVSLAMPMITSCGGNGVKTDKEQADSVAVDSVVVSVPVEEKQEKAEKKKPIEKAEEKSPEAEQKEAVKPVETPLEIGASPDAVAFLDDSESESTAKFPDGEKALKKLLKNKLRKAQKGEKANFKASIVIKADGSVGRVQFTACGYNDDYKEEIIAALKSLPAFTPGMKDGKAVDSWYYLTWKR